MAKHPLDHLHVVIGQRIRERRIHLGISQQMLANKMGLNFQQVQKYEHGANRMTVDRLMQAAHVLDRPITWFLKESEMPVTNDARDDKLLLQLTKVWPRLSREARIAVTELVKIMVIENKRTQDTE